MSTYVEYVQQVVAEFGADTIRVPLGSESILDGVGVTVEPDPSPHLSDNRVVEFYASGTLVARSKLP
jgi:hypothetical protein